MCLGEHSTVMRDEMMVYFELQYHTNNDACESIDCPNHMLVSYLCVFLFLPLLSF